MKTSTYLDNFSYLKGMLLLCVVEKAHFDQLSNLFKLNTTLLGTEDLPHLS